MNIQSHLLSTFTNQEVVHLSYTVQLIQVIYAFISEENYKIVKAAFNVYESFGKWGWGIRYFNTGIYPLSNLQIFGVVFSKKDELKGISCMDVLFLAWWCITGIYFNAYKYKNLITIRLNTLTWNMLMRNICNLI